MSFSSKEVRNGCEVEIETESRDHPGVTGATDKNGLVSGGGRAPLGRALISSDQHLGTFLMSTRSPGIKYEAGLLTGIFVMITG